MATTIGNLAFLVTANSSGVATGLAVGETAFRGFISRTTAAWQSLRAQLQLNPFAQLATWAVKLAASSEMASVQFEVLLGSASRATDMVRELRTLDAQTPLQFTDLRDATIGLLNVEASAESVIPLLQMMSDTSLGSSDKFQRMAYAMSQVIGAGRLLGTELKQMREAGFNPLAEIAKRTGESMGEVTKRMEGGGVSVREVIQAFQDATGPTGRYFGMTEKGAQTLEGRFSALVSSVKLLVTETGEKLIPTLKVLSETTIGVVKWIDGLDASTVQATIKTVAMTAAFIKGIEIAPKVIAAGMGIVRVLKAIASGQAIAQALGGPAGLATLAIGLAAAVGAGIAVNSMFSDLENSVGNATEKVVEARKEISGLFSDATKEGGGRGGDSLRSRLQELGDEAEDIRRKFEDAIRLAESHKSQNVGAVERFTTAGFEAAFGVDNNAVEGAVNLLREEMRLELRRNQDEVRAVEKAVREQGAVKVTEATF